LERGRPSTKTLFNPSREQINVNEFRKVRISIWMTEGTRLEDPAIERKLIEREVLTGPFRKENLTPKYRKRKVR